MTWCLAAAVVWLMPGGAWGQAAVYQYGTWDFAGGNYGATTKILTDAFFDTLREDEGVVITSKVFASLDKLSKAVAGEELDLAFFPAEEHWRLGRKHYRVVGSTKLYGGATQQDCLYVLKKNSVPDLEGLRGAKLVFTGTWRHYLELEELVGGPPETFFSPMAALSNEMSFAYAMAMGEADVGMWSSLTMHSLALSTPNVADKMQVVACAPAVRNTPILAHRRVPADVLDALGGHIATLDDHPSLKRFRPLIDILGFRFIPATEADYAALYATLEKAAKTGARQRYEAWAQYGGRAGK